MTSNRAHNTRKRHAVTVRHGALDVMVHVGIDTVKQAEMFAPGQSMNALVAEQFAQTGRRNELNPEMRLVFREEATLEPVHVRSCGHENDRRQFFLPRIWKHFAKPRPNRAAPRVLWR